MISAHPIGASLAQDVVTSLLASGKLTESLAPDLTSAITNCLQHKWRAMPPRQAAAVLLCSVPDTRKRNPGSF